MVIIYSSFSPVYMCKALCTCIISKLLYSFSSPPVEKQGIFFCLFKARGACFGEAEASGRRHLPPPFHFAKQNETRAHIRTILTIVAF